MSVAHLQIFECGTMELHNIQCVGKEKSEFVDGHFAERETNDFLRNDVLLSLGNILHVVRQLLKFETLKK